MCTVRVQLKQDAWEVCVLPRRDLPKVRVLVNGLRLQDETKLLHGDRLLLGSLSGFRLVMPGGSLDLQHSLEHAIAEAQDECASLAPYCRLLQDGLGHSKAKAFLQGLHRVGELVYEANTLRKLLKPGSRCELSVQVMQDVAKAELQAPEFVICAHEESVERGSVSMPRLLGQCDLAEPAVSIWSLHEFKARLSRMRDLAAGQPGVPAEDPWDCPSPYPLRLCEDLSPARISSRATGSSVSLGFAAAAIRNQSRASTFSSSDPTTSPGTRQDSPVRQHLQALERQEQSFRSIAYSAAERADAEERAAQAEQRAKVAEERALAMEARAIAAEARLLQVEHGRSPSVQRSVSDLPAPPNAARRQRSLEVPRRREGREPPAHWLRLGRWDWGPLPWGPVDIHGRPVQLVRVRSPSPVRPASPLFGPQAPPSFGPSPDSPQHTPTPLFQPLLQSAASLELRPGWASPHFVNRSTVGTVPSRFSLNHSQSVPRLASSS